MDSESIKISLDDSSNFWLTWMTGTDIATGEIDLGEGPVEAALIEAIEAGADLGGCDVESLVQDAKLLLPGESTVRHSTDA